MSNATDDHVRSARSDARAFADAFAAADDAFTFGPDAGESRTLSLAELGEVIALDRPAAATPAPAPSDRAAAPVPSERQEDEDDRLLTLDELGDALARPARPADDLDFDFGTRAHERARRRTAARLDGGTPARRRVSGPSPAARRAPRPEPTAADRLAMADASASTAELLAVPGRGGRFARAAAAEAVLPHPAALRMADEGIVGADGRQLVELTGRSVAEGRGRLREVQRDRAPRDVVVERFRANPDRVAMWAVLLGILLVLIAVSSASAGAVVLPLVSAL